MKEQLVLIGNGMAGVRTLEELLKLNPDKYDITVFGAEPYGNYNRILLSPVLAGEKTMEDIMINDDAWYAEHGITLYKGVKVTAIDRKRRLVRSETGMEIHYDRLLLATGSKSRFLPVPGRDLEGVIGFRDIHDVEYMLRVAGGGKNTVVIGGGLLGLEAANGLAKQGMDVTVAHHSAYLMNRQLDRPAADLLKQAMEGIGIKFRLKANTEALLGELHVKAVRFADGTEIPADLVVMAVGIEPNVALAKSAGIYCEQGIVVNDTLQTFDPRIYAVGECVQHRKQLFGLVAPVFEQAKVCANHLAEFGVVKAIIGQKLFTLEEVRKHTKASASCGSCTGLVEQILASTLGGDYSTAPSKKPMCGCTAFTHEEVRSSIPKLELKSIPQLMEVLEWKTPDGCPSCRSALNYYLLCAWPGEYKDDPQSRYINERAHANIQKDGTYSVVPRIWGGVTNPQELRAIADVAEKYQVPTVKITGGQRIDLLGIKKQDLPKIWGDLNKAGFVSGHAYGKSLRTVKTCVGKEWCRFGTQDSTGLGIKTEKMTWGSWTPAKFKIAVSGCPRNCAEASIKDLGVVCVDSGYEIHVGGNGGIKVRVTDFLCKVETEAEVLEYTGAFMQLYREEARYLERTAHWIERVGLNYVKQRLVDDPKNRGILHERFLLSQQTSQVDPWAERAAGLEKEQFEPIKLHSVG